MQGLGTIRSVAFIPETALLHLWQLLCHLCKDHNYDIHNTPLCSALHVNFTGLILHVPIPAEHSLPQYEVNPAVPAHPWIETGHILFLHATDLEDLA